MSPEEQRALVTGVGNLLIFGSITIYLFLAAAGKTKLKPIENDETGEKELKRRNIFKWLGVVVLVVLIYRLHESISVFL